MLEFKILSPSTKGTCVEQMDELIVRLRGFMLNNGYQDHQLLFTRVYFSDILNQEKLLESHSLNNLLQNGAVSYIEQTPLDTAKIVLQMIFISSPEVEIERINQGIIAECDGVSYIFHCIRLFEEQENAYEQTKKIFQEHIDLLKTRGWSLLEHCMRTWLYVRDIDRNYKEVVQARNDIFDIEGLTKDTHYIASTGIEGKSKDLSALVSGDFFSVVGIEKDDIKYLEALEFLNPTHEYGVAFERGTSLDIQGYRYCLISGTASIDKEGNILHAGDVTTQMGRLFLNISKLLETQSAQLSDMSYLIVYLRDITDHAVVDRYLRFRFPTLNYLIVSGRVCRPGWLIEAECITRKKVK